MKNSEGKFIKSDFSEDKNEFELGNIFGCTTDKNDIIASQVLIPNTIEVGDWVVVNSMGAYTFVFDCSFNGMKYHTNENYIELNN